MTALTHLPAGAADIDTATLDWMEFRNTYPVDKLPAALSMFRASYRDRSSLVATPPVVTMISPSAATRWPRTMYAAQNTRETGADGDLPGFRNWENPEHIQQLADLWDVDPLVI